ncbi:MAG: hypothetical protein GWN86_24870, partial [Desulfobacterales bacterium]|nr:hypothetical protein [Desulfobacterales bacterium]
MSKKIVFLQRVFSLPYEAGWSHVAAVAVVTLFFFVIAIFVESPANIQNIFPVAWAQSANSGGQDSVPVGEEEVDPGGEQEGAQAEKQGEEEEREQQEDLEDLEEQTIVDRIHRAVSAGVSNTAGAVDGFFDDERHAAEDNRTRLKLRFDVFFERGESVDLKPRANLSLAIPKTKKRLKLLVSGNPQDEDEDQEGGAAPAVDEDEDLEVAVAFTPVQTIDTNFSLRTGLKFSSIVPDWWIGPRWRGYSKGEIWGTRLTETFRWRTDDGFESITTLDFERDVAENFFYRTTLRGKWNQDKKDYRYEITPQLFQRLDPKRVLKYEHATKFNSTT